jgi:hypothetical protein
VAEAIISVGQRNSEAEGQRAVRTDMGIQVEGRHDPAHIAIFETSRTIPIFPPPGGSTSNSASVLTWKPAS